MSKDEERLKKARETVQRKLGFLRHLIIFTITMVVLAIINNTTYAGYQWWLWPALFWGIGVVSHFLSIYVFRGGGIEKKLVERELERMKNEQ